MIPAVIINKYADLANITASDLQNSVSQIALNASITSQQQQAQMQQAQAAQDKQFGGAGTAYSSFRQGAQQQLNTQNQGIIQSTAAQYQQQLRSAGEGAEQLYGSNYAPLQNLSTQYINPLTGQVQTIGYTPVGGLTGTSPLVLQQLFLVYRERSPQSPKRLAEWPMSINMMPNSIACIPSCMSIWCTQKLEIIQNALKTRCALHH